MKSKLTIVLLVLFMVPMLVNAKRDSKFHIYLCIGQSNMEAGAKPAEQDKTFNDPRFLFMAADDMPKFNRTKGNWYTAVPPICREGNNMGPVDFFGRKMIEKMPKEYRVGVINVSVAGAKIELWDKDAYKQYIDSERDWMKEIVKHYDGNPYKRLLDIARLAQKDGVIKGILVHQGESNSDDPEWPAKLAKIYLDLCKDLKLKTKDVPLLAGELKSKEQGGACYAFNEKILPNLPKILPNSYIISSLGCQSTGDQFHFNTEGMRLMGYRMAEKMLQLKGFTKPETRSVTLHAANKGIAISPTLSGIFFEDINQSLDGGICAQLIQNNSFQAYKVPMGPDNEFSKSDSIFFGWTVIKGAGSKGTAKLVNDHPLRKLSRYYDFDPNDKYDDELRYSQYCVRFNIENPGEGFGIAANGYGISEYSRKRDAIYSNNTQTPSIPAVENVTYNLGLYLQGESYKGSVKLYLEDKEGKVNSNVITISDLTNNWKKYSGELKAERSEDSRLAIVANSKGIFYLDFVTLLPESSQLYNDGKNGPFRKDLLEALAALHPKFMRFPGGCASEGPNYFGQVFWKNSIDDVENRIGFRNHWGYWSSQYIGFYEYFLMAEALGASPLPVLNNGVTCQFAGHSYIAPLETEADKKRFHDIYVKDALDLIEFCNGDVTTEWGSKRAKMGHPAPFNLKYLGIGNENQGKEFWDRFDIIYQAVKAKYPDIIIISTAGAADAGKEFNNNYAQIDAKYKDTYVDEHYYKSDDWFYKNTDRYNADKVRGNQGITYNRIAPTRVFVGEFANSRTNNIYASAMAEAAYWTGLERNSDMVSMAAYAPLLCKKGYNKWNSNLIWFDNRGLWRTCNYYYQTLFSVAGDHAFEMTDVMNGDVADSLIFTSPTIDTKTGELFVKVVNSEAVDKILTINLDNANTYSANYEFISSHDTSVKNQGDQNYYSSHEKQAPVKSKRGGFPGFGPKFNYTEAVIPHTLNIGEVKNKFTFNLPENSVGVIRLTQTKLN